MRTSRNERLPHLRSARFFFAAFLLGCFSQCAKPIPKVPATLTLSSDPKASESLHAVRDLWTLEALSDGEERKDLDRRLREHLARFPDDASFPIAKIHAAWMLIENGEPANAIPQLRALSTLPPGWVRDFRDVVQAKAERVLKRPKVALSLLEPLDGKIVDNVTQSLFLAELAMSTLETGDEKRAIFRLDAWLRLVATDERDAVLKSIHEAVDRCSTATLTSTLEISKRERKLLLEVERIVIERIAQIAVSTNDHELARWLFSIDARSGESATNAELHQLSTHETYAVQGRTVGLVLPTSTPKLRAVATEVARGLAWSLGLPRKDVDADTLRLVTREDNGLPQSLERAMAELASDGATIIVAGFDADASDRARAWAQQRNVATFLVTPPSDGEVGGFTFSLGEELSRSVAGLVSGIREQKFAKVVPVVDAIELPLANRTIADHPSITAIAPVVCDDLTATDDANFQAAQWQRAGVRAFLVLATDRCARELHHFLRGNDATTFLSLDALGDTGPRRPGKTFALSAGIFPLSGEREDVARYRTSFGSTPKWATALGRDAGALIEPALRKLKADLTKDRKEVERRRLFVRDELRKVNAELWTSELRQFGESNRMLRSIKIVPLP